MGVPKAKPNAKKGGEGEEKKTEKRSGCEAAALGQWVRGAAKPPVQRELRSPWEAAGTGHRACRIPESSGACLSHRAALALPSPGNCMEHRTSGFLLSSPPAFPALGALPAPLHPLCPVGLLSLLPKQTWRGHAAFLPHCACSWLFCCSFRICPHLLPHCGGRTASFGEWQSPMVRGPCPCLGLVQLELGRAVLCGTAGSKGCAGMRSVPRAGLDLWSSCASAHALSPLSPRCQVAF